MTPVIEHPLKVYDQKAETNNMNNTHHHEVRDAILDNMISFWRNVNLARTDNAMIKGTFVQCARSHAKNALVWSMEAPVSMDILRMAGLVR